jgi:hypothetical protein
MLGRKPPPDWEHVRRYPLSAICREEMVEEKIITPPSPVFKWIVFGDRMEHLSKLIVNLLLRDLQDRSGLNDEWDQIDEGMQQEIREEWERLALKELRRYEEDTKDNR